MDKTLIARTALEIVTLMMSKGLSYREGLMVMAATQRAMQCIDADPNVDEDVLIKELKGMIYV